MMRLLLVLFFIPAIQNVFCQQITYSERNSKDRSGETAFEIVGRYNNNYIVYKQTGSNHFITVYNNDLTIKQNTKLSFIPDRVFNADIVAFKNSFSIIYQYAKKGVIHCVAVPFDSTGAKTAEPKDIDTTALGSWTENRIYSISVSEDKQKVLVYKMYRKSGDYMLATMLYNQNLELLQKSRMMLPDMNERRRLYSDVSVDNKGDLVFAESLKSQARDYIRQVNIITKAAAADTFSTQQIDFGEKFTDAIHIKIDNLNNSYLLNTFYYKNNRGSIEGLATSVYLKTNKSLQPTIFTEFNPSLRQDAKRDGMLKFAFDNYFIRNVIVKKDGGFILTAEDYSFQTRGGTNWSRWDYMNNPNLYNYYGSYYGFYRPWNSFRNQQSTRHYYDNILLISADKDKAFQWASVIQKEQYDDDNEAYLSYGTMVSGGQIYFLFNDTRSNQIINNQSLSSKGEITRNSTLKSQEKGYQFLTRYAKQTGASEMLMPCNYRGVICFAKIEF